MQKNKPKKWSPTKAGQGKDSSKYKHNIHVCIEIVHWKGVKEETYEKQWYGPR